MSPWSSWSRTKTEPKTWLAKRVTGFYISWNMLTCFRKSVIYFFSINFFSTMLTVPLVLIFSWKFGSQITQLFHTNPQWVHSHILNISFTGVTLLLWGIFGNWGEEAISPMYSISRPNFHIRKHISSYIQF